MAFYNPPRLKKYLYDPKSKEPFRLSRSGIDLFVECPRCFYLDKRLGIGRPPGFPFSLNSAVDHLLKKEFDIHRANGESHPLMESYKINAIPFAHKDLNTWRENFEGIKYFYEKANLIISGAIDDIWINDKNQLIVVDYKSTAKEGEVTLDAPWQDGYKRQMEIYQWLFRKNGFDVLESGYFVYCNGDKDKEAFDGKLDFKIKLIEHKGKCDWIEPTINKAKQCLDSDTIPEASEDCDYCKYRKVAENFEGKRQEQSVMIADQITSSDNTSQTPTKSDKFSSGKLF
ncbi:MAG: PD-(D/E)XK nuclease superfamily protein [candidate division WS2 bacterium ADurb.Bin280]|uniref:PD-(D/E)XK nuclease superfamily protein n=1 Tax=candidate division WS2 bacterium ADurb.Bin280 TaxID=1852829 RepID=A0A1V5SFN4_9BACT|nr:MAG: PD-(D/E)XK nuclease superfamily protein [candidate division WS2 bacterium ADurb.Bin280]